MHILRWKAYIPLTLDGSDSGDPNPSDILSYYWAQVSGPSVTLENANTAHAVFTPIIADTYVFELTVSDGRLSDTDTVTVIAEGPPPNHAPVAQDQSIITNEDVAVNLILVATDMDNDPLTYSIVD